LLRTGGAGSAQALGETARYWAALDTHAGRLARALRAPAPKTIDLTLERVQAVRDRLGLRFEAPVITVAGTNGKGSSCAMLESIALNAGMARRPVYQAASGALEERCRIGPARAFRPTARAALRGGGAAREGIALTYFEFTTLAILARASRRPTLDVVISKWGWAAGSMPWNAIDTDCALITSIAIDRGVPGR
jgi:dihydrofolate synthase/folylpolyglutamate synthase